MKRPSLPWVGARVVVQAQLVRHIDGRNRLWEREDFPEPRRGLVVGYSHRCDGVYSPAAGGRDLYGESDYEPAFLGVTRKHLVVLVRFWAWGPETPVLPADVLPAPDDGWVLPSTRGTQSWTSTTRHNLREWMQAWPRDARGRWTRAS